MKLIVINLVVGTAFVLLLPFLFLGFVAEFALHGFRAGRGLFVMLRQRIEEDGE